MKTFPLLCLLFSALAFSQTTYKSDYVNINTGDPGWASFYFGNSVTLVGDTELFIQCDFNRAELIYATRQDQRKFKGALIQLREFLREHIEVIRSMSEETFVELRKVWHLNY